jgi:hypothetical protein
MPQENKLPSTLGPTEINSQGIRTWGADAAKFDPSAFYEAPQAAPPPIRDAVQLPISHLPDTSFVPQKYVVHLHSQSCEHCKTVHEWASCYAYNELQVSALHQSIGKHVRHLVPVNRFSYNVKTEVQRLKQMTVPFCHECARTVLDLSHLPTPPKPEPQRVYNPQATASPEPADTKSAKKAKTIDDLLF